MVTLCENKVKEKDDFLL